MMHRVFGDTFYFLALVNPRDAHHRQVVEYSKTQRVSLLTTEWVLTEVGDALSQGSNRHRFKLLMDDLHHHPGDVIIPASHELFENGLDLFNNRPDKEWTLTDCISFHIMEREGVQGALTQDHHFEQAGFVALLKP